MDLYEHQQVAVDFLSARTACGLYDEPGLGKTGSTLCAARRVAPTGRTLVVVPTALTANWRREAGMWWPGARVQLLLDGKAKLDPTATIVVTTHGLLLSAAVFAQLTAVRWDVLAVDEAHAFRNPKAQRTQRLLARRQNGLVQHAARCWVLTGTPVVNNPTDLWTTLASLAPERLKDSTGRCMSWHAFRATYCQLAPSNYGDGYKIVGSKNTDDLKERLKGFSLRRTKADVLKNLPPLRWGTLSVTADHAAMGPLRALEAQVSPVAATRIADARTPEEILAAVRESDQFMRWRRACGLAKVPAAIEVLNDELEAEPTKSIVVFVHHREVGEKIAQGLLAHGVVQINGEHSAAQRQAAVDAFQGRRARVAVCQIDAAGVGLTLTAAQDVVFVEQSWTPGANRQAADRCHRIGQTGSVLARVLVLADSIDEIVAEVLARKQSMIAATTPS